jgi:cytochrome P450
MGGKQPYKILELHEKYGMFLSIQSKHRLACSEKSQGPMVRIAPNELSFNTSQSWRDIYAARKDHLPFIKSEFYEGGNFAAESLSIVSERDPKKHAHMRKYLANAFGDRSLREQESLIQEVVDELIEKLAEFGEHSQGTNMVMWFNLATFDVHWNTCSCSQMIRKVDHFVLDHWQPCVWRDVRRRFFRSANRLQALLLLQENERLTLC